MKKAIWAISFILGALIFFFLASPHFESKRKALGTVGKTLVSAPYHQAVIVEGGSRVLTAQHNLKTIARATEYMGTFGSGTLVFREIARIAAEADKECLLLESVLDLAARSTSESQRILALAETACMVEGTSDEAAWMAAYEEMAARAQYPSVAAAIASQGDN
ncbi:MAG: hypothetical protein ABFS42_05335 [Candidatus Krumholzibacteriota bacterium]